MHFQISDNSVRLLTSITTTTDATACGALVKRRRERSSCNLLGTGMFATLTEAMGYTRTQWGAVRGDGCI